MLSEMGQYAAIAALGLWAVAYFVGYMRRLLQAAPRRKKASCGSSCRGCGAAFEIARLELKVPSSSGSATE